MHLKQSPNLSKKLNSGGYEQVLQVAEAGFKIFQNETPQKASFRLVSDISNGASNRHR